MIQLGSFYLVRVLLLNPEVDGVGWFMLDSLKKH